MSDQPLIDTQSVSPPSSPKASQLSAMIKRQSATHQSASPIRPHKLRIVVNYWSDYSEGDHYICELEVSQNDKVRDVISWSTERFSKQVSMGSDFLLRFANKKGQPKTDMPKLNADRCIVDTNYMKFALCECCKDDSYQEELEPITNLGTSLESSYEVISPPDKKTKRIFCCCFSSD